MTTATENQAIADPDEVLRLVAKAQSEGQADNYAGKRQWTRYLVGLRLEASLDPRNPSHSWAVVTHNVSGGGVGIWSHRRVPPEARFFVRQWSQDKSAPWLAVRATHCTAGIRGYLVGTAFCSPAPADADRAAPAVEGNPGEQGQRRTPARGLIASWHRCTLQARFATTCMLVAIACTVAATVALTTYADGRVAAWALGAIGTTIVGLSGLLGWLSPRRDVLLFQKLEQSLQCLADGQLVAPLANEACPPQFRNLSGRLLQLGAIWQRREEDGRLQRKKLEELNEMKSGILATVSHDLRTPLTSILLYTQMLSEEMETLTLDDRQRFLGIIAAECTRLSRLVDDLLELQRLEGNRDRWHMQPQDLSRTVLSCARLFEPMARTKGISFSVDCPSTLPAVEADADRISQVLTNLLSNALKFTPGGGTVTLTADADSKSVIVCVADTGPGIPRDRWDQVFDRFVQLADPNVRETAGCGLGLYIVKQIIERHAGAVWVDSEVGKGSRFFVSLPIRSEGTAAGPDADGHTSGRVIVCDADPELAAMLAQTLRVDGFEVDLAHSGCRLLALLAGSAADVVITDVLLPDMNASELLDALDRIRPKSFGLVVHSYAGDGPELRRRGVDVFLRRPASRQELVQAVRMAARVKQRTGLSVLLVEGEGMDTARLQALLTEHGHMPILTEDLAAAAQLLRSHPIDLVLLSAQGLSREWREIQELSAACEWPPSIVVLSRQVRGRDRRLADHLGVRLMPCASGDEQHVVTLLTERAYAPVTESST